jgi:hypothetical protein
LIIDALEYWNAGQEPAMTAFVVASRCGAFSFVARMSAAKSGGSRGIG